MAYTGGRQRKAPALTDKVEALGSVRRSQLVSSFGIGAVVDLEKGSFMPLGLEKWEPVTGYPSLSIGEPRLQAMLKVSHFRLGPVKDDQNDPNWVSINRAIPATRFPKWHECPRCNRIGTYGNPFELGEDGGRLLCTGHNNPVETNPVRFVLACRSGHIEDFPWEWWAHRSRKEGICNNPILELGSHGHSASLSDLFVRCKSCNSKKSLGDAFKSAILKGIQCSGNRPWLLDREEGCNQSVHVIQRGASNVYFGIVCSALSIPPVSESISLIVQESRVILDAVPESALFSVLEGLAQTYGVTVDQLLIAYQQIRTIESEGATLTEQQARVDEYMALSQDRNDSAVSGVVPEFCNQIASPPESIARWFDLIGAVSRLREVRALVGFSRIEPYSVAAEKVNIAKNAGLISPLSKTPRNWLPAAEIRGEGIFFRFRTEAVDTWVNANPKLTDRAKVLERLRSNLAKNQGNYQDYKITPRLLLVHSFSHALLRQISVECGYSTSALRERLYISESEKSRPAMNGVLIYTGSPDSEGSLGGLVRLADPCLLEQIVKRTLERIDWCGSDPVCIESDPAQSGERISGAVCHHCLLLPETACEKFNRELDRSVLVGDAQGEFCGYFDGPGVQNWLS